MKKTTAFFSVFLSVIFISPAAAQDHLFGFNEYSQIVIELGDNMNGKCRHRF